MRINVRLAVAVFTVITYYPSDHRWESWYSTVEDCQPGFKYKVDYDRSVVTACWWFDSKQAYWDDETKYYDYEYYRENKRKREYKRAIRDNGKCGCHDRHRHEDKHNDKKQDESGNDGGQHTDKKNEEHHDKTKRKHLVIGGGGGQNVITYTLTVSGELTSKSSHGGRAPVQDRHVTMDPEDYVNGRYALGTVAGGYDTFYFTGQYQNVNIRGGNATCWIDGQKIF